MNKRWRLLGTGLAIWLASFASMKAAEASFETFDARARAGEPLNIVFFGGSLTWGAQATDPQLTSYRANLARLFEAKYPSAHFHYWDASIGGIGSQMAAFRVQRDVLARKPDLVFLDYTVNDGPYDPIDPDKLASYESLVRRIVAEKVPLVQAIFALKNDMPPNVVGRELDAKHKEIAAAYSVPVADAIPLLRAEVEAGRVTTDELWPMAGDNTHPGDKGYVLYAQAAWEAYQKAVTDKVVCQVPPTMVNGDTYMGAKRHELLSLPKLPEGWKAGLPSRSTITYDFMPSRWMDHVAIAEVPKEGESGASKPGPLVFEIRAKNAYILGDATPKSGKMEVWVDGTKTKTLQVNIQAKDGNLRYFENLAAGLDPEKTHRLELIPILEPGEELRLESVCLAGGEASLKSLIAK